MKTTSWFHLKNIFLHQAQYYALSSRFPSPLHAWVSELSIYKCHVITRQTLPVGFGKMLPKGHWRLRLYSTVKICINVVSVAITNNESSTKVPGWTSMRFSVFSGIQGNTMELEMRFLYSKVDYNKLPCFGFDRLLSARRVGPFNKNPLTIS